MHQPKYELYWEDIGERVIYAELDDCAWKLAEQMFGYRKQRALYIYRRGKLAAFYDARDAAREARVGHAFYTKKHNREKVIALKRNALRDARKYLRAIQRRTLKTLSDDELQKQLLRTLDAWHAALSAHFLSQPQFFTRFEREGSERKHELQKIGKARFKTRDAFGELWTECRRLFCEYAGRYGLTQEEAESMSYGQLKRGARSRHLLRARSQKFVMLSHRHKLRVYTGTAVVRYVKKYEQVSSQSEVRGIVGNPGTARARAFVIKNENLDFKKLPKGMKWGMILVAQNAWPEIAQYFKKASAIVTNEGGITSHGVVIARELGVPCVVGTMIGTRVFKTGDAVEVDANMGVVRKLH